MQEAVARLEMAGFDRADLSLSEAMPPAERATPEAGARPVDTEEDAQQTRTLSTGGAAAADGRGWGGHRHGQSLHRRQDRAYLASLACDGLRRRASVRRRRARSRVA
jgi:hypothetical protein